MMPYTIPRHLNDHASPRSTPAWKKKNKKNISGENVPRQISNVEGSRLIEADTYQCVLADVHLAGCTINYGFHWQLWSCPEIERVPFLTWNTNAVVFNLFVHSLADRYFAAYSPFRHVVFRRQIGYPEFLHFPFPLLSRAIPHLKAHVPLISLQSFIYDSFFIHTVRKKK